MLLMLSLFPSLPPHRVNNSASFVRLGEVFVTHSDGNNEFFDVAVFQLIAPLQDTFLILLSPISPSPSQSNNKGRSTHTWAPFYFLPAVKLRERVSKLKGEVVFTITTEGQLLRWER